MTPQIYDRFFDHFIMTQDASDPDVTTVTLTDRETGMYARGNAKRVSGDHYDESVGIALASFRAISRMCNKLERRLIRSL